MVNLRQDWGYIPPSKYASSNFGCDSELSRSLMPWSCSYLWWSCSGDNVEDGTMMVMVTGLVWVVCSLPRISSRLTALQLPICPPGHIVLPRNIANGTIVCTFEQHLHSLLPHPAVTQFGSPKLTGSTLDPDWICWPKVFRPPIFCSPSNLHPLLHNCKMSDRTVPVEEHGPTAVLLTRHKAGCPSFCDSVHVQSIN